MTVAWATWSTTAWRCEDADGRGRFAVVPRSQHAGFLAELDAGRLDDLLFPRGVRPTTVGPRASWRGREKEAAMARELRGSDQARRAGLWDEVRPEALVPAERDPLTGSLTGSADSDGGAKDRRTESSRSDASPPAGPRWVRGRWPVVAAAGAVALVVGVGGAVALANRGDGPRSAAPSPTATPAPPPASGASPQHPRARWWAASSTSGSTAAP